MNDNELDTVTDGEKGAVALLLVEGLMTELVQKQVISEMTLDIAMAPAVIDAQLSNRPDIRRMLQDIRNRALTQVGASLATSEEHVEADDAQ